MYINFRLSHTMKFDRIAVMKIVPLRQVGICLTGDGSSSLNAEASKTETGLGKSAVRVASSAKDLSSPSLGSNFLNREEKTCQKNDQDSGE